MLTLEEKLTLALNRLDHVERKLELYVEAEDQWLSTAQALQKAGIKSRTTLIQFARASAPGKQEAGRITYSKEGTRAVYSRASCIDYRLRKQGYTALAA
jgi:hypothetical protein